MTNYYEIFGVKDSLERKNFIGSWYIIKDKDFIETNYYLVLTFSHIQYRFNILNDTTIFSYRNDPDEKNNICIFKRKFDESKTLIKFKFRLLDNMTMSYEDHRMTSLTGTVEALPFEGMTGVRKDFSGRTEQSIEWDNFGNHISMRYIQVSYTGKPYDRLVRSYTGDGRVIDNYNEAYALFPGGYYKDGSDYRYITDYQGNNVAVLNSSGGLVQSTDYYPYGEPWLEPEGQPWLYSGNERLRMDGINEYDFNARRYNSALGCFTTWDPLCEKRPWESPYAFCGGDPVNYSDPSGLEIDFSKYLDKDKYLDLGSIEKIVDDLSDLTGLSLFINEGGILEYKKESSDFERGSETARHLLISAIESESVIEVDFGKNVLWMKILIL
ncbi:MAG: hypothetical protein K2H01_05310 [Ruminococcus sp.]|nr:hypothetical protein [Ruminococcus sp.]